MIPTRDGRFRAEITEHGVDETGPNSLTTFVCRFRLIDEFVAGEWRPVDSDWEIVGYFYLERRDGSLNIITIDMLRRALGWDGRDPFWLQDANLIGTVVQVRIAAEEYNGRARMKVQYIDAADADPVSVRRADDSTRRAIEARLGPKLRANAGGTPAPAPKPQKPAPKPARPVTPATQGITMQQAWEQCMRLCSGDIATAEQRWTDALNAVFPGREEDSISPAEWKQLVDRIAAESAPF